MKKLELLSRDDLEQGLLACLAQRMLPDCFLYAGAGGADNWLALDGGGSFAIASNLTELLRSHAAAIAGNAADLRSVVSLGVGAGQKERILLEHLAPGRPRYLAVDVSSDLVDRALAAVEDLHLWSMGVVAMTEDLPALKAWWTCPALLCLLGNNFSNYDPQLLLGLLAGQMEEDDLLLVDFHLCPAGPMECWREQVQQSYGSPANAQFNLAPLVGHGLPPDAAQFELELTPVTTPVGVVLRTRKRVHILRDAELSVAGRTLQLRAGEHIQMGFTFKYTASQVQQWLGRHAFEVVQQFADDAGEQMLVLARQLEVGDRA